MTKHFWKIDKGNVSLADRMEVSNEKEKNWAPALLVLLTIVLGFVIYTEASAQALC